MPRIPAPGCTGGCWLPAAPRWSWCIPAHPGSSWGRAGSAPASWLTTSTVRRGPDKRGAAEYVLVIHRLGNAVRFGTYGTGEARGKGGSGSGERQPVCCKLLCLRGKSLPELSRGARVGNCRQDKCSSLWFPAMSGQVGPQAGCCGPPASMCKVMLLSVPREGQWAPEGHMVCPLESSVTMAGCSMRCEHTSQGCSAPCTLSGDVPGSSVGSWRRAGSIPVTFSQSLPLL